MNASLKTIKITFIITIFSILFIGQIGYTEEDTLPSSSKTSSFTHRDNADKKLQSNNTNPTNIQNLSENEDYLKGLDKEAYIKSAGENKILKISYADCIMYALKKNFEVKIRRIDPQLRQDDVKIAESFFEPLLNIDYIWHDNTAPSAIPFISGDLVSKERDTALNVNVEGELITGTTYNIAFLNNSQKTNSVWQTINPVYTSEPIVTVTQPVLRGAGIAVNKANIYVAQNNKTQSEKNFQDTVMDIITRTETAYYAYIYTLKNYSISQSSLDRAQELADINKARYKKGLISSVDLLETEAAVAEREKAVISAESLLKKAEDLFKLVTNLVDDPTLWNAELQLTDLPQFKIIKIDLVNSLENAFKYRPDYQAKIIDLENLDIQIMVTKNALLPTLDLIGSFGLNGLGDNFGKSVSNIDADYKDWTVGFNFTLPWGGGDRARYDSAKLQKKQALITFKRFEQTIILEVRDRVREVDIQYRQVKATKVSRNKERKNYKAQLERYNAGQVSTHDILDYQDKLSTAELDYTKALIDYNVALIDLDKAEGLTLSKNNVILEE